MIKKDKAVLDFQMPEGWNDPRQEPRDSDGCEEAVVLLTPADQGRIDGENWAAPLDPQYRNWEECKAWWMAEERYPWPHGENPAGTYRFESAKKEYRKAFIKAARVVLKKEKPRPVRKSRSVRIDNRELKKQLDKLGEIIPAVSPFLADDDVVPLTARILRSMRLTLMHSGDNDPRQALKEVREKELKAKVKELEAKVEELEAKLSAGKQNIK